MSDFTRDMAGDLLITIDKMCDKVLSWLGERASQLSRLHEPRNSRADYVFLYFAYGAVSRRKDTKLDSLGKWPLITLGLEILLDLPRLPITVGLTG